MGVSTPAFIQNQMINEFFDNVVVLTTSRRERCEAELKKYGIEAQFFRSLSYPAKKSFNMSMKAILERFVERGGKRLLILEDDVEFRDMDKAADVFTELGSVDWEILYLGGNYKNTPDAKKPDHVSKHLRRIYNAWATHAIAFTDKSARWIYKHYKADGMFDAWLDENALSRFTTIATVPMLAVQAPFHSDIWGHEVDYSGIWDESITFIS